MSGTPIKVTKKQTSMSETKDQGAVRRLDFNRVIAEAKALSFTEAATTDDSDFKKLSRRNSDFTQPTKRLNTPPLRRRNSESLMETMLARRTKLPTQKPFKTLAPIQTNLLDSQELKPTQAPPAYITEFESETPEFESATPVSNAFLPETPPALGPFSSQTPTPQKVALPSEIPSIAQDPIDELKPEEVLPVIAVPSMPAPTTATPEPKKATPNKFSLLKEKLTHELQEKASRLTKESLAKRFLLGIFKNIAKSNTVIKLAALNNALETLSPIPNDAVALEKFVSSNIQPKSLLVQRRMPGLFKSDTYKLLKPFAEELNKDKQIEDIKKELIDFLGAKKSELGNEMNTNQAWHYKLRCFSHSRTAKKHDALILAIAELKQTANENVLSFTERLLANTEVMQSRSAMSGWSNSATKVAVRAFSAKLKTIHASGIPQTKLALK